jgi:hypothetical protein
MKAPSDGIRIISGTNDLMIVAPHAPIIAGEYQNDIRTGVIAEAIQRKLGCMAVINHRFFKPKGAVLKDAAHYFLDLYRIDHSRKVPGYLECIDQAARRDGRTLVIWLHGITDDVAVIQASEHSILGLYDAVPETLMALIGYGQGGDPKTAEAQDRFTARRPTVETLRDQLTAGGITTLLTHRHAGNYRGRDSKRLNQWFIQRGIGFDRVESLHLELREKGLRDSDDSALYAAAVIAKALEHVINPS